MQRVNQGLGNTAVTLDLVGGGDDAGRLSTRRVIHATAGPPCH